MNQKAEFLENDQIMSSRELCLKLSFIVFASTAFDKYIFEMYKCIMLFLQPLITLDVFSEKSFLNL